MQDVEPQVKTITIEQFRAFENLPKNINIRIKLYFQHGARLAWAVYPETRQVQVNRLVSDGSLNLRYFSVDDSLDGADVIPGLSVAVREFFPTLPESATS